MAQSFTVQLTFGSHRIENVTLQWGLGWAAIREGTLPAGALTSKSRL
ncbi:hypothetical protein [Streptomyces sp. NPDC021356]